MKTFFPLNVSSKFAICGVPLRADTYKTCSFGCEYCFSNNRKIMEFDKELQVADVEALKRRIRRILDKGAKKDNFLDTLIEGKYTWHLGGMSDPFQPCEKDLRITESLLTTANENGFHTLISTKSDTVYGAPICPDLNTFQLSVTNVENSGLEPGVPRIEKRIQFYRHLKQDGFKVGIRVQPFVPGLTTTAVLEAFPDADMYTIEGLKLVPQNREHVEKVLQLTGIEKSNFTQMGLLNLKPEYRIKLYEPFIAWLESRNKPYSIADNDLHYMGNQSCCCGDRLVHRATAINNTHMYHTYGNAYSLAELKREIETSGLTDCVCNSLFTSNRQEGCRTVMEFVDKRFDRPSSPFSPKFSKWFEKAFEPEQISMESILNGA